MTRSLFVIYAITVLCSCTETVSRETYEHLEQELDNISYEYDLLYDEYQDLKFNEKVLEDSVSNLENEYKKLMDNVKRATDRVSDLIDDYNKYIVGHWALDAGDIADDAEDVYDALDGIIQLEKIRTKNGIRY